MKDFFKNLVGKLKRPIKEGHGNFTGKLTKGIVGKLKHLSETAKATGKLEKLSTSGINFNWDELIGAVFSPAARPHIHKAFLVLLTASTAYVGGKGIVSLLPEEDILKKQKRLTPMVNSSKSLRSEVRKIKDNNIFNARTDGTTPIVRNEEVEVLVCSKATRKSSLPIKLLYTTVMQDSVKSLASVQVRSKKKLESLREGQSIGTLAKLDKIERQRLILKNKKSGECEYIENKGKSTRSAIARKSRVLSPKEGNELINSTRPKQIQQIGNKYVIKKSYRDEMLKDISKILTQAKAVQIKNPDGTLSFKMTNVVPGSLYSHFGIQNGDTIKGINGEPIRGLNKLMMLFGNIKNIDNAQFTVIRDGQEKSLEASFVD
ncbi:MAG: hypothetical protein KAG61_00105 [Bacteriovoracaceae bacterium]|nr:hypothetical protein [Bacteriovoracaceae bacterium]